MVRNRRRMPPRRCTASMGSSNGSESDASDLVMRCLSCEEEYDMDDSGTCRECYQEANEAEEELRREIEELKSKVSRSPVFKAMLENDMAERRSGTIKISDISYDTLSAFVNYLYTAEASLDNELACNLLVLGEKYQVKHLKTYCEKYLIAKMNWNKAISNYAFAYQYNCKQLRSASLAVILDNMDLLTQNECYAELVDTNPRLVVEIYETYIGKQLNTAGAF
ncbi:hypothetical protein JHK86_015060 [Glycine max]|nr:hypothetical protein JHK86_015060 [Glycine max]